METLIFIDTNIFLDFYRQRKSDISLKYLDQVEESYESIILTSQVEMEYKKNRQSAILESLSQFKDDLGNYRAPPILNKSQPAKMMRKKKEEFKSQQKLLRERITRLLSHPSYNDKLYQSLNRIFKKNWGYHQNRVDKDRFRIRKLAIKRFLLGYPPRKKDDTAIGDAINWEYIIDCAIRSGKDIVIVSRDGDFGVTYGKQSVLNDWLLKEFKKRVSTHRSIELTNSLSYALKKIESEVTEEMESAENEFILQYQSFLSEKVDKQKELMDRIQKFILKNVEE